MTQAATEKAKPIMMKSLFTLAEEMILQLPGASDLAVRKALQRACRKFCQDTAIFRQRIEIPVEEHVYSYLVVPNMSAQITHVDKARLVAGGSWRRLPIVDKHVYQDNDGQYWLVLDKWLVDSTLEEDEEAKISVQVTLIPDIGSEELPCGFVDKWGQAIIAGAMIQLCGTPGVAWSNPGLAQQNMSIYHDWVTDAAMERMGGINGKGLTSRSALPWI